MVGARKPNAFQPRQRYTYFIIRGRRVERIRFGVVVLRGGKEAINSNIAMAKVLGEAVETVGLPKECVQIVTDTSRETANQLMKMKVYVALHFPQTS